MYYFKNNLFLSIILIKIMFYREAKLHLGKILNEPPPGRGFGAKPMHPGPFFLM
jgi:hypothetical protein